MKEKELNTYDGKEYMLKTYFIINNLVKNTSIFFLFLHYLVFFSNWLHNIKGIYSFFPL